MLGYFLKYMLPKSPFYAFLSIRCVNYCKILHVQQRFRDTRNFDEIILNSREKKKLEFRENFAKINDFIFAIFREIQNNVVKISWFAKLLKCCFASTLPYTELHQCTLFCPFSFKKLKYYVALQKKNFYRNKRAKRIR